MIKQSREAYLRLKEAFTTSPMDSVNSMQQKFNTYHQSAEEELIALERLTGQLHKSEPDESQIFIAYDEEYNIEHIGEISSSILGYTKEELLGSDIVDVVCCGEGCGEDESCSAEDDLTSLLKAGNFSATKIKLTTKTGNKIWVKLSGLLSHDAGRNLRRGIVFGMLL